MIVPTNFHEWACSLSGCDGGNIGADVWISGIEWGGGSYDQGKYYSRDLPQEISAGEYKSCATTYDWAGSLTYRYGVSFAKLYAAMNGRKVEEFREFVRDLDGSQVFKLNLYPIAFDSTDPMQWKNYNLDKITGFSEKHIFQTWCFYNRFPVLTSLVAEYRPKTIIGTGNSYLRDFFSCFGGNRRNVATIQSGEIATQSPNNRRSARRFYWAKISSQTTLFVIPFFSGSNGLNSNELLQQMGYEIARLT